jgi:hypothetical protein
MRAVWSKRWSILLVVVAAQTLSFAGVATALGTSFFDGFGSFDTARWSKGNHTLGRSYLYPATGFHEGRLRTWDTGVPRTSKHLMLNTWFASWLDGRRPKKTAYTYVDSINYTVQP